MVSSTYQIQNNNNNNNKNRFFLCFTFLNFLVPSLYVYTHTQKSLSRVRLFATPWIVAHQAPPSMGFSRHEYWSGLLFPSPLYIYIPFNYLLKMLLLQSQCFIFFSLREFSDFVLLFFNIWLTLFLPFTIKLSSFSQYLEILCTVFLNIVVKCFSHLNLQNAK